MPTFVPPGENGLDWKIGEFCTRWTDVCVSPQTVPVAESEVPLEKVYLIGIITTGTVVVADPDAGLVPIIVNGNVVPLTVKLLLHMGMFGPAALMAFTLAISGRGLTM